VAWKAQLQSGEPLGRLVIPALGVSQVVVQGTGTGDLERGPGHYAITSVPGLGRVSAVAGHRTTFGAPFRHLDKLEVGDTITFALPYGTFLYRVIGHKIVRSDDWSIIKQHGFDELVLSACHPLYSASHRWVVFARLAAVNPKESHP
jgi:sortase A